MKIAQICPRYAPEIGGVETHVKEISEKLVQRGHAVDVITTDPTGKLSKNEIINGVNVIRFKAFAPGNAYFFAPQIYSYLKNQDYDIVHAHSYHALPAFFAALARPGKKFVFTPHYHRSGHTFFRNLLHKPYRLLGRMIFSRAYTIICVSEFEKGLVNEDFNVSGKIEKIPNGINLAEFEKLRPQKDESGKKTLLYVGRLEEYKGVQYIIQALPELPDFKLKIVGKGPYEDELHKLADQIGVFDRIEWLKGISRDELLNCYASADIFLMLSKHEAYGITVAEALAAGTPCVVARGSALDEFVDGIMCIGIEVSDIADKLIESICTLKNNKIETLKNQNKLMDWESVTDKIITLYEK
ncbi:glycosyltransferase family 4 protein [Methanococcoides methylutens]|uniref:Glycosyl transferase, group 1 n=1 Tax=Methanococcoides methylutens MM1 TaxID=1434104 RepID=A0A0E3SSH2_METMT|nr:glycosyltransferase family 4 protein [Methanococcoides methylutens]AKB86146.1 Glycosyl transferase, group 1 [Methanococcoides methylutens MM1]